MKFVSLLLLALVPGLAAMPVRAAELLVFAASSTTNAVTDINALYRQTAGGRVAASFASTGILARQIENGAPAQIILSANRMWLDYLATRNLLARGTRTRLAGNRLVLIAPARSPLRIALAPGFADNFRTGRLAIADPGHTPAGMYARAALRRLGVWQDVSRRTARAANVREALMLVERGEATAGIVYETDARASGRVRVVARFPSDTHPPIVFEAALIGENPAPAARRYIRFLASDEAAAIFRRHGFEVE